MRYFIELAYDGTAYHGWQTQPNGITVQQTLEAALCTLLHSDEVSVVGAGRTDAGVHARFMVAHFDCPKSLNDIDKVNSFKPIDCTQLTYKLNKLLPPDISIYRIFPVSDEMHARFSATSRTYHYFVHTRKNPFLRDRSCFLYLPTDFEKMNEAARVMMEYEDFTSFSKTGTQTATNICHLTQAVWTPVPDAPLDENGIATEWRFTITANRFLRNMVRAIVGTLLQVGQGKLSIDGLRKVIEKKDRCTAGESVTGAGLFLTGIKYDFK